MSGKDHGFMPLALVCCAKVSTRRRTILAFRQWEKQFATVRQGASVLQDVALGAPVLRMWRSSAAARPVCSFCVEGAVEATLIARWSGLLHT
jgi:hypothetical protein